MQLHIHLLHKFMQIQQWYYLLRDICIVQHFQDINGIYKVRILLNCPAA